jgi:hypothetical protein
LLHGGCCFLYVEWWSRFLHSSLSFSMLYPLFIIMSYYADVTSTCFMFSRISNSCSCCMSPLFFLIIFHFRGIKNVISIERALLWYFLPVCFIIVVGSKIIMVVWSGSYSFYFKINNLTLLMKKLRFTLYYFQEECKRVSTEGQNLRLDLSAKFQDAIKVWSLSLV